MFNENTWIYESLYDKSRIILVMLRLKRLSNCSELGDIDHRVGVYLLNQENQVFNLINKNCNIALLLPRINK